jgi:hypothetical protein
MVGAAGIARAQGTPPNPGAACNGTWSSPFAIQQDDGRPVYVERGLVAPLGTRTLILGYPTYLWLTKDHLIPEEMARDTAQVVFSFTRGGVVVDDKGIATGVPMVDSLRGRKRPSLLGTRNGVLTTAWESHDPRADGAPVSRSEPVGVDVASFDGQRWTPSQTIIRAPAVRFTEAPAVRVGTSLPFDVIAVTALDSAPFVRLARATAGAWSVIDWRSTLHATFATAFPARDGAIVIALMGYPRIGFGSGTGVFAVRGQASGGTMQWSEPQRIDSISSTYSAFSSAVLGGDTLVLVWSASGQATSQNAMRTLLSADGGKTWKSLAPLVLSSGMDGERLVVDASGGLHVVYRGAREDGVLNAPGGIMHSRWIGGTWTRPVAVSPGESMTIPGAGASSGGRLVATWTEATWVPQGPMPKSIASFWTPGCPAR